MEQSVEKAADQARPQDREGPGCIFTWVILIVVIVVLFFVLMPVNPRGKPTAWARAMHEISVLNAAIMSYQATYGRFPMSSNLDGLRTDDFTFGTFNTSVAKIGITNASGYQANNSEVMAILTDLTKFPDGRDTPNHDHSRNPHATPFFAGKFVQSTNLPGIGPDGVFRDPWGNPYIISFDLNGDGKCRDAFYRLASVSETNSACQEGIDGLTRPKAPPYNTSAERDAFEANATVMIWSLGPDGKADSSQKAVQVPNKDNLVSWRKP